MTEPARGVRRTTVARWISILAHPFGLVALLVAVPAMCGAPGHALRSVAVVGIAIVFPLTALMIRQVRRGRWENVDASNPAERPLLFAVALAGVALGLGWLLSRDPQSYLVRGLLAVAAFLFVAAILTRWIKVSLHVGFGALTATTLSLLGSPVGYALIPVVAALFWSRLVLARHSVAEALVGLLLGGLTGVALVLI